MRLILQVVSFAALLATIAAPILFFSTRLTLDQSKAVLLVAAIVWFATAPLWMGRHKLEDELVI